MMIGAGAYRCRFQGIFSKDMVLRNGFLLASRVGLIALLPLAAQAAQPAPSQPSALQPIQTESISVQELGSTSAQQNALLQKVVIDRQQIETMGVMTVGDVLGKLPGIESFNGSARARGMSRDSVQMLVDGERQSGGGMGPLSRLPASEIERVEIVRGNSAEFGGSSAITVNVVLKKALNLQPSEYKIGIGLRKDELNDQVSYTMNSQQPILLGEGKLTWSIPFTWYSNRTPIHSTQWRQSSSPDFSWLERADGMTSFAHMGVSPKITWKSGRDSVTLMPMIFYGPSERDSDADISATPAAASYRRLREDSFSRLLRLRMNGEKMLGESKLSSRISLNNRVNHSDTLRYSDEPSGSVFSRFSNNNRENESNLAFRFDHPIAQHYVSLSAEMNNLRRQDEQLAAPLLNLGVQSAQVQENILWLQDAWTLSDAVALTTGVRVEQIRLSASGVQRQTGAVLPSLAWRWQPNPQYVFRSALGAGLKAPKLNEISNAATPSVALNTPLDADVRGNPQLKPERNINLELAMERYWADQTSVMSANLYVRSTQHFTERIIAQEGGRWVDRPQNVGDSLHWGIELDAKLKTDDWAWQGGTLRSHLVIPRNRVEDDRLGGTRRAKETPVYSLSVGLDQQLPQWKSTLGLDMQIFGRSETALPGEQYALTKSRTLLDAYWLYQIDARMKLRVVGRNLLAEDTLNRNRFVSGADQWQYRLNDYQYPSVMVFLEGSL